MERDSKRDVNLDESLVVTANRTDDIITRICKRISSSAEQAEQRLSKILNTVRTTAIWIESLGPKQVAKWYDQYQESVLLTRNAFLDIEKKCLELDATEELESMGAAEVMLMIDDIESAEKGLLSAVVASSKVQGAPQSIPNTKPKDTQEEETASILTFMLPSAAGIPLYVEGEFEQRDFPKSVIPPGAEFAIRIDGDSMEPTITDGSYVFVRKQQDIQIGQIGIFMIGDGDMAVCKRYRRDEHGVRLISDNPNHPPIVIGEEDEGFRLVGKVLGHR